MAKNYLNESLPIGNRLGQIGITKYEDTMKIIEYYTNDNIIVEMLTDNPCQVHTQYINFLKGNVKNYNKVIYGYHGYLGQGPYSTEHLDDNGIRIRHIEFGIWKGIHCRSENFDGKHPSYKDVTVCEEWWNYQNFAKWYNDHKYNIEDDFLCIDKDILYPESKIYSPKTCCLIPNSINEIFKDFKNYKNDDLPIGVSIRNDSKSIKYRARTTSINEFGDVYYSNKTFDNVLDAFIFYKVQKEKYIKYLANKYKNIIDNSVYLKLIEYEVTTTYNFSNDI